MGLVEMTFELEGGIGGLSTPQGHKKKITNTASLQKKADKPPTPQFDFCSPIFTIFHFRVYPNQPKNGIV